jgi:hypothetical protein
MLDWSDVFIAIHHPYSSNAILFHRPWTFLLLFSPLKNEICLNSLLIIKPTRCTISQIYFGMKIYILCSIFRASWINLSRNNQQMSRHSTLFSVNSLHVSDTFRVHHQEIKYCDVTSVGYFLTKKIYMFQTVPLSIISSYSPYTQQWYMSYSSQAGSGWSCSSILILLELYDIYHCCVYGE